MQLGPGWAGGAVEPVVEELVELLAGDALRERDELRGGGVAVAPSRAAQSLRISKKSSSPTVTRSACRVIAPRT